MRHRWYFLGGLLLYSEFEARNAFLNAEKFVRADSGARAPPGDPPTSPQWRQVAPLKSSSTGTRALGQTEGYLGAALGTEGNRHGGGVALGAEGCLKSARRRVGDDGSPAAGATDALSRRDPPSDARQWMRNLQVVQCHTATRLEHAAVAVAPPAGKTT